MKHREQLIDLPQYPLSPEPPPEAIFGIVATIGPSGVGLELLLVLAAHYCDWHLVSPDL